MTNKQVKGYEGLYTINEYGDLYSFITNKKLKRGTANYATYTLCKKGGYKKVSVHRLVALHFIPNPENKPQVNHKDGNKLNNNVSNLEWCTALENNIHAYNTGLKILPKGKFDKRSVPILQYRLNGELVREWECARQCQREGGFRQSNIWHCLKGNQKKSQGFIWKYQ